MKPEIAYVYDKLRKLRFDFNSIDFRDFRSEYRYEPTLNRYVRKDDNDLFIDKNTFKPLEEELEYADKCHNLEEQLGCPLDVYVKLVTKQITTIYDVLGEMCVVRNVDSANCICVSKKFKEDFYLKVKHYKKTWWLKETKEE